MQIVKPCVFVVVLSLLVVESVAQNARDVWQSWNEIQLLSKKEKRPLIIDIYTDWCRYCKLMEKNTYGHDSVKSFLQANYYRLKFNAETRDSIMFMGRVFKYNPIYKVHDLVLYLTKGNVAYPATVIVPAENQPPYFELGAIEPKQMELILKYFSDKKYFRHSLTDFSRSFTNRW